MSEFFKFVVRVKNLLLVEFFGAEKSVINIGYTTGDLPYKYLGEGLFRVNFKSLELLAQLEARKHKIHYTQALLTWTVRACAACMQERMRLAGAPPVPAEVLSTLCDEWTETLSTRVIHSA